jgi:dienelactone hydrolase
MNLYLGNTKWISKVVKISILSVLLSLFSIVFYAHTNAASPDKWQEKNVSFTSNNSKMQGTVLMPNGKGKHPGIVLVHGSGQKDREKLRQDAQMFVKAGFATLIYDKRDKSKSRTMPVLANDALAAVHTLQAQSGVDPRKVGIWGFSEGAWVAPIAASQSKDISFVVLLGTPVVTPIQQQTYHILNRLFQNGITSTNVTDAMTVKGARFVYQSNLLPEADHDAISYLQKVKQPILAVWGAKDRLTPAAEGSNRLQQIWKSNGNKKGSILFVANAEHAAHQTDQTGFERFPAFAAGYETEVLSWLDDVVKGNPPNSQVIGQVPSQDVHVYQNLIKDAQWYDTLAVELGIIGILLVCYVSAMVSSIRNRKMDSVLNGYAGWTIASGLLATIGFASYFVMIWSNGGKILGPVLFERPIIWLIIQGFSLITTILTFVLAFRGFHGSLQKLDYVRLLLLLIAGTLFTAWAVYWGLLLPF